MVSKTQARHASLLLERTAFFSETSLNLPRTFKRPRGLNDNRTFEAKRVFWIFSSFETQDNLRVALKLFQAYLTNLTNIILGHSRFNSQSMPRIALGPPGYETTSKLKQIPEKIELFTFTKAVKMDVSLLKTVRNINRALTNFSGEHNNPGGIIGQSTQLYTVIKSPHVYKKKREQFAITKVKSVVSLDCRSTNTLTLLKDSFLLTKFPDEIKMVFKNA